MQGESGRSRGGGLKFGNAGVTRNIPEICMPYSAYRMGPEPLACSLYGTATGELAEDNGRSKEGIAHTMPYSEHLARRKFFLTQRRQDARGGAVRSSREKHSLVRRGRGEQ
jgi:hypothetical protein